MNDTPSSEKNTQGDHGPDADESVAASVKRDEILDSARIGNLVAVVGTGVSLQTAGFPKQGTEVAGWPGLLSNGVKHCVSHQLLRKGEEGILNLQIKDGVQNGNTDSLLGAADIILRRLEDRKNGQFFWLKESIGQLQVQEAGLINAIKRLGGIITTLNYDNLIEDVTGLRSVHWLQQSEITKLVRERSTDFVFHIHGHWETPDSIVLDNNSYSKISSDEQMQDLLRTFARFHTMLFIGCGGTFFDPNFQRLLNWAKSALLGAQHRHFILCREGEEPSLYADLQEHGYLEPLVYGGDYQDLVPFLNALASETGKAASTPNPPLMSDEPGTQKLPGRTLKPFEVWKLRSQR